MPRALISVSDKRGIEQFAKSLTKLGWEIISTGGTARVIGDSGVAVKSVDSVTGFPEIMDGRVKTLHPAIHAGLLARRDVPEHMNALEEHGITPIDMVVVNLYPFRETIADPNVSLENAIEQIDIGGPSMLRSAAKNFSSVVVVVDPSDYQRVLDAVKQGDVAVELRKELAAKVFTHTALYDSAISDYLGRSDHALPHFMDLALEKKQTLRYGENPNQKAALYVTGELGGIGQMWQRQGKELSFNNILDMEGATAAVANLADRPACAVVKHTTPCGIALGPTPTEAYRKALSTDPTSAFGSVIAFNTQVDEQTAEAMRDLFVEVVVAPRFTDGALEIFSKKQNLRVVEIPTEKSDERPGLDFKRVRGGMLVQDRFRYTGDRREWKVVTEREPTENEWRDLEFAWAAVASVKSNAILLAKDEAAIGIGAGQMSRVDASFLAVRKCKKEGHDPRGAVLASDAFFPFADGVDEAATAGVTAIIQPGGSKKDDEVIEVANMHNLAMVMTGMRQFRH
ncbi:MAG: bifunctional phosphoribosylaminoimidazolecarboxamide formyltransferase/IMP cyclohydrolase [Gemmatimonadota bacterium]|nr:bifunctional phosphoribosylaminoimidazolecarboxamide formyltransferase/IMP cyclohydrolase [Gemmatimonadota bacterium]